MSQTPPKTPTPNDEEGKDQTPSSEPSTSSESSEGTYEPPPPIATSSADIYNPGWCPCYHPSPTIFREDPSCRVHGRALRVPDHPPPAPRDGFMTNEIPPGMSPTLCRGSPRFGLDVGSPKRQRESSASLVQSESAMDRSRRVAVSPSPLERGAVDRSGIETEVTELGAEQRSVSIERQLDENGPRHVEEEDQRNEMTGQFAGVQGELVEANPRLGEKGSVHIEERQGCSKARGSDT